MYTCIIQLKSIWNLEENVPLYILKRKMFLSFITEIIQIKKLLYIILNL